MKSKNLITRILFSLFAIALLATVAAAQTAPAKTAKPAKTDSAMAAPGGCRSAGHQLGHQGSTGRAARHRREVFAEDH